jgi:hypothetical protein
MRHRRSKWLKVRLSLGPGTTTSLAADLMTDPA